MNSEYETSTDAFLASVDEKQSEQNVQSDL